MVEISRPTLTNEQIKNKAKEQIKKDIETFKKIEKKEAEKNKQRKSKKIKRMEIKGKQTFIDQNGQPRDFLVVEKNIEQDFNFHKIWINDLVGILEIIGTKKLSIIKWLLGNMNNTDNTIYFTQRGLSKELKISLPVINETIKLLIENNFMTKIQNGVYRINPDIIVKGGTNKRINLAIIYKEERENMLKKSK